MSSYEFALGSRQSSRKILLLDSNGNHDLKKDDEAMFEKSRFMEAELPFEETDGEVWNFDEQEFEEALQALYNPGFYRKGEDLCLDILEDIAPDWEPARLFLMLYIAAQDEVEDSLVILEELADDSLFEALRLLAFGEGTEAEEVLYQEILSHVEQRGLEKDLEMFLRNPDKALERCEPISLPKRPWLKGGERKARRNKHTSTSKEACSEKHQES